MSNPAPNLDELLLRLLGGVRLFEGLGRNDLASLLVLAQKAQFDEGQGVFNEGDRGEWMFVLISGRLEVFKAGADGNPVSLAYIEPGDVVGEMSLLMNSARAASVRATAPSVALSFFKNSLDQRPALAAQVYANMARLLARRLARTNQELVTLRES
ncbi:MAG: cyclic nucleotide-binding domain-containing protein [Gammaproteobacteria bacterium]|nr:cyclic nucleotide-binding domain-containing protein [Gammaproteobacteria bacterium]